MKVMSIDASTKSTGVAIMEGNTLIKWTLLTASSHDTLNRIESMARQIGQIYDEYLPDAIIMEDVLPSDVKNNQKVFKALIYLQAAIILEIHKRPKAPEVRLVVASHWRKQIGIKTGRGVKRETLKKQVMQYIKDNYNVEANDDVCDGIAIGAAYLNEHSGFDWS